MYRIRLTNGEEAVYKTVAELTTAVSSGVVSADAQVFHSSGNRWLPIKLHPDYAAAAGGTSGKRPAVSPATSGKSPAVPADATAKSPAVPTETTGKRPAPTFPAPLAVAAPGQDPASAVAPIPHAPKKFARSGPVPVVPAPPPPDADPPLVMLDLMPVAPAAPSAPLMPIPAAPRPAPPVAVEAPVDLPPPTPKPVKPAPDYESRAKKLRTMLALAMAFTVTVGLTGAVIMARPWLSRKGAELSESLQRTEGMDPAPLVPRVDSGFGPFPAPSAPYPMAAAARLDSILAYGTRTTTTQRSASRPRAMSYSEAYADAREEMDTGLDYIDFRRVFAGYRFANPDSIRSARRMVSAAGNILRVYRGREVMLEQTYRADDPGGRGSLRESFETSEASRSLISDVDSLFGLLVTQQGRFTWTDSGLRFQEAKTAKTYQRLRNDIMQSMATWRDSAPGPNRTTYPRLLAGLGQLGPPPAR